MLKLRLLLLAAAIAFPTYALAVPNSSGLVVTTCGNQTYIAGRDGPLTVDLTGTLCANTGGGASTQDVNITQVGGAAVATGHGTASGALRVELPTDGTGKVGLNAGTAIIGKVGIDQTTPGTTNGVQVNAALPAGSNVIGHVIVDSGSTSAVTQGTSPWIVAGGGTAGSAATGVVTVQGIASMTPLGVSAASGAFASGSQVDIVAEQAPVAAATATATKSFLTAAQYLSTKPTYTNTQQGSLLVGTRGALLTQICGTDSNTCASASSAGADTLTNATSGLVTYSQISGFNGTDWDRIRTAVNSLNSVGLGLTAAQNVAQCDDTSPTAITENSFGNLRMDCATHALKANIEPLTTGGLSNYFVQPAASDNHVVIKAGAGTVYGISVTNNSATINYLRLYNATTGFNGCNSATNIVGQWAIPASTSGAGISLPLSDFGIAFATGISICVTSGYATTDTTNATASAMSVNVQYK